MSIEQAIDALINKKPSEALEHIRTSIDDTYDSIISNSDNDSIESCDESNEDDYDFLLDDLNEDHQAPDEYVDDLLYNIYTSYTHLKNGMCYKHFDDLAYAEAFEKVLMSDNYIEAVEVIETDGGYVVFGYQYPEHSIYDQMGDSGEYESMDEMKKRKIKINSKGQKRVKIKCQPGFKFNGKTCVKITGRELATKRKSVRKSILTKKSKGKGALNRQLRLTKKAKRFRKSFGLKT